MHVPTPKISSQPAHVRLDPRSRSTGGMDRRQLWRQSLAFLGSLSPGSGVYAGSGDKKHHHRDRDHQRSHGGSGEDASSDPSKSKSKRLGMGTSATVLAPPTLNAGAGARTGTGTSTRRFVHHAANGRHERKTNSNSEEAERGPVKTKVLIAPVLRRECL